MLAQLTQVLLATVISDTHQFLGDVGVERVVLVEVVLYFLFDYLEILFLNFFVLFTS